MLVLLPPSEAKRPGGQGPAVGARPALSTPALAGTRATLLRALARASRVDPAALAAGLKLPASAATEALLANRSARTAPTMPALDRYSGVVYAALGVDTLTPAARRRAEESVLVFSGLWGVVRGDDLVPAYRVPAGGTVPGLGGILAHWRAPLAAVLPDLIGSQPVLDLRSTDYRAMWRPSGELAGRVVTVRVLAERGAGRNRTVAPVSHHAKSVKGAVVRHLVTTRRRHTDPLVALASAAEALDLRLVEGAPDPAGGSGTGGRVLTVNLIGRIG